MKSFSCPLFHGCVGALGTMIKYLQAMLIALTTSTVVGSLLTSLCLTLVLHGDLLDFIGLLWAVSIWSFLYLLVLSVVLSYPIFVVLKCCNNVIVFSFLGFCSGLFLHPFTNFSILLITDFRLTSQYLYSDKGLEALAFHGAIGGVYGFIFAFSLFAAYRSLVFFKQS